MKPTLLILAAGIGSRYGGIKQLDQFGPNGETIIDYSLYDAIRAGFGKVVFIVRQEIKENAEAVFTPSQTADQTLALVQPDTGGPFVYQYQVTGYSNQGLPIAGDRGESADLNLFVRVPTA